MSTEHAGTIPPGNSPPWPHDLVGTGVAEPSRMLNELKPIEPRPRRSILATTVIVIAASVGLLVVFGIAIVAVGVAGY
ncbi:MAG TPA: hypothetical protein VNO30_09080 [Kofleriaceae bacterium]|nr:hypothetical protein [Kofleriaceae bacterium]